MKTTIIKESNTRLELTAQEQRQLNSMITELQDSIEVHENIKKVVDIVLPELKQFEGKKITKRIEAKIANVLPNYRVHYQIDSFFGYPTLLIRNDNLKGFSYNDTMNSIRLTGANDKTFTMEHLLKTNSWITCIDKHIQERKADLELLNSPVIDKYFQAKRDIENVKDMFKSSPRYKIK